MTNTPKPTALVTGDIVLDCHLYGGVKTAATSFSEPGTSYTQHLGGAVLTQKLLRAAIKAAANAEKEDNSSMPFQHHLGRYGRPAAARVRHRDRGLGG